MSTKNIDYKKLFKNSTYIEDIDVDNVDLSKVPEIKNPFIAYANLHNTKLRLLFTRNTNIRESDLRGTIIKIEAEDKEYYFEISLNNVLLDENQINYLNELRKNGKIQIACDYQTLKKNPNLYISNHSAFRIIKELFIIKDLLPESTLFPSTYTAEELKEQVAIIEDILNTYNLPEIKMIYDNIKDQMNNYEKINMFTERIIGNKTFHDLTINSDLQNLLQCFTLINCKYKNIIFNIKTAQFTNNDIYTRKELDMLWETAIKRTFDLSLSPNGTLYDDWSENHHSLYDDLKKNQKKLLKK